jgi:hypothetical protein
VEMLIGSGTISYSVGRRAGQHEVLLYIQLHLIMEVSRTSQVS